MLGTAPLEDVTALARALCREAAMIAIREHVQTGSPEPLLVSRGHFEQAIASLQERKGEV